MFRLLGTITLALAGASSSFHHGPETKPSKIDARETQHRAYESLGRSNGSWLGWGGNIFNNRLAAPDTTVNAINAATLEPRCRKEYAIGVSAAPLVVQGVAYFPTRGGLLVALDYRECEIIWQTNLTYIILAFKPVSADILGIARAMSRTTPVLKGNVLFLGTLANALVLAVDKWHGKLIDKIQISDHPVGIVTMSPTLWQSRIFVGTSSQEETAAAQIPGYLCCSFIGSMNALAFRRGRLELLWKQDMVPQGSNFSGAAIWGAQPPIDPGRNQVFAATGNVYSVPPTYEECQNRTSSSTSVSQNSTDPCAPPDLYQESVIAFDITTGHINWFRELSPLDAWNVACSTPVPINPGSCPPNPGPDADFGKSSPKVAATIPDCLIIAGMAPSFVPGSSHTPYGKDTLVVGQKNGNLYGLSAQSGELFWATATSPDGVEGGLIWGLAVDASAIYYTAVNSLRKPWQLKNGTIISNSAFGAASLASGEIMWDTTVPRNSTSLVMPSVANDVVLVGVSGEFTGIEVDTGPGTLIALDKRTGAIIKETGLISYFQSGIAIVEDRVLFGTGYPYSNNATGSFEVWQVTKS